MPNFATRLREIRKEHKLRQKDLAQALSLAQTTIANYEQSTRFPDEQILSRIADFFGVSLDFLLGRTDVRLPVLPAAGQGGLAGRFEGNARKYLDALLSGDREIARDILAAAQANGMSYREIYTEIFERVLIEVGTLWETGRIDVFQEHFISAMTELFMGAISEQFPSPSLPYTAIGITVGGEMHHIGMRMVLDFLALEGWNTRYLGTNLPTTSVLEALRETRADLLCISVTMAYNRNQLADLVEVVRSHPECGNIRILVGGRALNEEPTGWRSIPVDGYAASAEEAIEAATRLVKYQQPC
jgi:methanogenic corrinoid protein MtbC1